MENGRGVDCHGRGPSDGSPLRDLSLDLAGFLTECHGRQSEPLLPPLPSAHPPSSRVNQAGQSAACLSCVESRPPGSARASFRGWNNYGAPPSVTHPKLGFFFVCLFSLSSFHCFVRVYVSLSSFFPLSLGHHLFPSPPLSFLPGGSVGQFCSSNAMVGRSLPSQRASRNGKRLFVSYLLLILLSAIRKQLGAFLESPGAVLGRAGA